MEDATDYTTPMTEEQDRLKAIKREHKLSWQQIAELVGVSLSTARSWSRNPVTDKSARSPGPCCLELLELKLKLRRQS